jgi:hypothetical protein
MVPVANAPLLALMMDERCPMGHDGPPSVPRYTISRNLPFLYLFLSFFLSLSRRRERSKQNQTKPAETSELSVSNTYVHEIKAMG